MAGRRGKVTREEYKQTFDSFKDQLIQSNKIVKPSEIIWKHLNDNIFTKSNPKAIYTAALRWFDECKDNSDSVIDADEFDNISIEIDHDDSFNNSTVSNPDVPRINFNVHLSAEVWKTIAPIPKNYEKLKDNYYVGNGRQYFVLKPGVWTNVLSEKIADHRKDIICNIAFKRNKVYATGAFYVTVSGKCINCGATVSGFVKQKPLSESDSVKFSFSLINFNEELHRDNKKTVRNSGEKASKVFSSTKSALNLHQQMNRNVSMFQNPKGRQFSLNSIRCGKFKRKSVKKISTCPYTAITYLQAMNCYRNTIHQIGMSPFAVIYISPNQIRLFYAYKKANPYTRISGDSSGGFAHKLERPSGTLSSHIFLYSFVISDDYQVSVASAFTEKQDMSFINYYMNEWQRLGGSIPNEFIADMSPALLGAAVQSFARMSSTADYIHTLFNLLNGVEDKKPKCFIRIDIAHFIKSVTSCKQLKAARIKHKDFFVRSVALMIKMTNLNEARQHILEVLVIAMSSTEGSSESGIDTPCETYKRSVIRKIKGIADGDEVHTLIASNIDQPDPQIIQEEDVIRDSRQNELLEYVDAIDSTFNRWILDIENEAKEIVENCDDGDRDNLMFNPGFAVQFRKMCKPLLLWSAMCCSIFNSPYETSSSSNVESDFKNVKLSLSDVIPCRVDIFIQKHLEMLDGAVKIASAKYVKGSNCDDDGSNDFLVESDVDSGESRYESVDSAEDGADGRESISNCVACANGDIPGGAHKCYKCGKDVHILPGCSLSIGGEEGHGEKRICIDCSKKGSMPTFRKPDDSKKPCHKVTVKPLRNSLRTKVNGMTSSGTRKSSRQQRPILPLKEPANGTDVSANKATTKQSKKTGRKDAQTEDDNIFIELNHKEKWSKPKKVKRSIYTRPSPFWDLITNVNKKVKLGFLTNGSCSKNLHYVNKVQVSVGNTCCFDSIAQVLAAAYAYLENFRKTCEESPDRICEIAILLAKNANQKKINNLRASLLHSIYNRESFELVLTTMLNKVLANTPSYTEVSKCTSCKYSQKRITPIAGVNSNFYDNKMHNLEIGVLNNFPVDIMCNCTNKLDTIREFGEHFFIELPSCTNYSASLFEETSIFKIKDVPMILNVLNHKYVLFGLIIFKPPFLETDIGHYVAAIRLNNKWEEFDDFRSQPHLISPNANVVIHAILYIKSRISDDVQNEPRETLDDNLQDSVPTDNSLDRQKVTFDENGRSCVNIGSESQRPKSTLVDVDLQDNQLHSILTDNSSMLEESVPQQDLRDDTCRSESSFEISEHRFESFYRLYHQELAEGQVFEE